MTLTKAGRLLLAHAEAVAAAQQQLIDQLLALRDPEEAVGRLRLGASTTLSQYVLPAWLSAFQQRYPQVQLELLNVNSENIAGALLSGELDLGFVERRSKSRDLHYGLLMPDELVAVRRARPAGPPPTPVPLAEALARPLVLRERGSGTLGVLYNTYAPAYVPAAKALGSGSSELSQNRPYGDAIFHRSGLIGQRRSVGVRPYVLGLLLWLTISAASLYVTLHAA